MKPAKTDDPTVGVMFAGPIPDQREIRPDKPVRTLAEFVRFLEEIESVFGPIPAPSPGMKGDTFLL